MLSQTGTHTALEKMQHMLSKNEPNQTVQRFNPTSRQTEVLMFLGTPDEIPSGWFEMPRVLRGRS